MRPARRSSEVGRAVSSATQAIQGPSVTGRPHSSQATLNLRFDTVLNLDRNISYYGL
jgi:hypothetical protein